MQPVATSFSDLGLDDRIVNDARKLGIVRPFPVQALAIPPAVDGHNVVALAPTGRGKSFAFIMPAVHYVLRTKYLGSPMVLVLAESEGLGSQLAREFRKILGGHADWVAVLSSPDGRPRSLRPHQPPPRIVVGTPYSAHEACIAGQLEVHGLGYCIIDEADKLLREPARRVDLDDINTFLKYSDRETSDEEILAAIDDSERRIRRGMSYADHIYELRTRYLKGYGCRVIIASATVSPEHEQDFADMVGNGVVANALIDTPLEQLTNRWYPAKRGRLTEALVEVIRTECREGIWWIMHHGDDPDVPPMRVVLQHLRDSGIVMTETHPTNNSRGSAVSTGIAQLSENSRFLFSSGSQVRGLDLPDVAGVVHVGTPSDRATFIHSSGRAGRAGRDGTNIVVATRASEFQLGLFAAMLKLDLTVAHATRSDLFEDGKGKKQRLASLLGRIGEITQLDFNAPSLPLIATGHQRDVVNPAQSLETLIQLGVDLISILRPGVRNAASEDRLRWAADHLSLQTLCNTQVISPPLCAASLVGMVWVRTPTNEAVQRIVDRLFPNESRLPPKWLNSLSTARVADRRFSSKHLLPVLTGDAGQNVLSFVRSQSPLDPVLQETQRTGSAVVALAIMDLLRRLNETQKGDSLADRTARQITEINWFASPAGWRLAACLRQAARWEANTASAREQRMMIEQLAGACCLDFGIVDAVRLIQDLSEPLATQAMQAEDRRRGAFSVDRLKQLMSEHAPRAVPEEVPTESGPQPIKPGQRESAWLQEELDKLHSAQQSTQPGAKPFSTRFSREAGRHTVTVYCGKKQVVVRRGENLAKICKEALQAVMEESAVPS